MTRVNLKKNMKKKLKNLQISTTNYLFLIEKVSSRKKCFKIRFKNYRHKWKRKNKGLLDKTKFLRNFIVIRIKIKNLIPISV